jgi:hypothetical protein
LRSAWATCKTYVEREYADEQIYSQTLAAYRSAITDCRVETREKVYS